MSEESKKRSKNKERSPQQLAKSRREAQDKVRAEDKRTQEAAEIHRALGIKALKGSAAATALNTARTVYIQLLAPLGTMPKSRRRSLASVSSLIRCNCRCWPVSHANVRAKAVQHRSSASA
jgi:hypothetical protein